MKHALPFALALLSSTAVHTSFGQIAFGGQPYGPQTSRIALPEAPEYRLPEVDEAALIAEDAARLASGVKGASRFGWMHTTAFSTANSGLWHTMPNGDRVWRIGLHCPQSKGIGIIFSNYVVPEGARVFLYNHTGKVLGGYTAMSNPGSTVLGVQPIHGDRIIIEYVEPAAVAGQGTLTIGNVTHAYRADGPGFTRDFGDSGECNVNVICPDGDEWRNEIRSVACIIAGGGYCTGTLLNNCNQDSIPYFLTANHCLGGSDPSTWVFRFNWDSPVCDPTENAPTDQTVSGSTQLAVNPGSDMLFLQLNTPPPTEFDVYYAGWDATGVVPDSGTCIHHPAGDIKKISHDHQAQAAQNVDVGNGPADCWHVFNWESGTTEPGSSGSALWNQNHMIVGQLYGGAANCANNVDDYFGRFDVSYPFIAEWLGDCDTLSGLEPGYIEPEIQYNAAITSISNVPPLVCDVDSIHPIVTLKNNGTVALGAVSISYIIAGGDNGTFGWTGNLLTGQTANVQLPWVHIIDGPQELIISSGSPNGQLDQVPEDDGDTLAFVAHTPGDLVVLEIIPDDYGEDITWELADDDGNVLYNGGPYSNQNNTPIVREFCLGEGCYEFTINDVFGDGICCTEGEGSYSITSQFNDHVTSNGEYGSGETRDFCIVGVGLAENADADGLRLWPNPATTMLQLSWDLRSRTSASWQLLDLTGRVLRIGIIFCDGTPVEVDLGDRSSGTYLLRTSSEGRTVTKRVVVR